MMNIGNMNMSDKTPMDSLQFGSVGLIPNQSFGQPQQTVINVVYVRNMATCLSVFAHG